jgi:mono/diheme cytochrome c family protein
MLRLLDRGLMVVSWVAAALVVVLLFAGPSLIGAKKSTAGVGGVPGQSTTSGSGSGTGTQSTQISGKAVFTSAGCSRCHTLKDAGATGSVGPNLDQVQPSAADVSQIVKSGSGVMPSFSGKLSDAQIAAVATYVSSVAGH